MNIIIQNHYNRTSGFKHKPIAKETMDFQVTATGNKSHQQHKTKRHKFESQ